MRVDTVTAEQITTNNTFQIYYKVRNKQKNNQEKSHTPCSTVRTRTRDPKRSRTCSTSLLYAADRDSYKGHPSVQEVR